MAHPPGTGVSSGFYLAVHDEWIDFLRSVEGMELFATLEGRTPGRGGVKVPKGGPSAEEPTGIPINLKVVDENEIKNAQAEFKRIMGLR